MRAVVQRVSQASVAVEGSTVGEIGRGLLVLLAVARTDTRRDADWMAGKIVGLRVFTDEAGKLNRGVLEAGGAVLAVSQFTLYGDCRKGRRPSFDKAAGAVEARALYEYFVEACRKRGAPVETGVFQASMAVTLVNDGPVTLIIDSDYCSE